MKTATLSGKAGEIIGAEPRTAPAPPAAEWTSAFRADIEPKYEDGDELGGKDVSRADLPPAIRAIYEWNERNTADGVGIEKHEFDGNTAYAIHDYSCVSSVAFFSPEGSKLFDFVS